MFIIVKGIALLLMTLGLFSLFSFKAPKGREAMSGLAGAAIATFLVEAIHKYIFGGDMMKVKFLFETGNASGSMGGPAAAILAAIAMRANPVYAVVAGAAVCGMGILPGFIAGYLCALVSPELEKRLPAGLDSIVGPLLLAPLAFGIAKFSTPMVDQTLGVIGQSISEAATQSPILMGFLLGGIIKMICTSPLSSMALTAMLGLTGLPMGIAAIACVGGSFTNGIIFKKLKLGDQSNVIAVMLEPLTQADVVTRNALPIYSSNFFGGGLAGISAAYFGIVNNTPGTASPIPGLLAPFGCNSPMNVVLAIIFAILGGIAAGYTGAWVFTTINNKDNNTDLKPQMA